MPERIYCPVSCLIQERTALACYYPEKRKTNSIWETVTLGYDATVIYHHEDFESYNVKNCRSREEAKKHLRQFSVKII